MLTTVAPDSIMSALNSTPALTLCQRDLPVRYRPTPSSTHEDGKEAQQPPTLASYFIYGICGALAPIILVLGLKLSGLSGGH